MCVDINTLKRISLSWIISIVNHLNHHNHAGLRDCKFLMTHAYVVNLTVRSKASDPATNWRMYVCTHVCMCVM